MLTSRTNATKQSSSCYPNRNCFLLALIVVLSAVIPGTAHAETIHVSAGGNVQAALNSAQLGDTITLAAGATFVGPFTLPNKPGTSANWITIRTSAPDSSLPPEGQRITPAYASVLPKVVSPGSGEPALRTAPGAHHYRFVGVEFRPIDSNAFLYSLIVLGDFGPNQDTLEEVPHHLTFDRCYIYAFPAQGLKRGVELNSASTDILNSHISGFKVVGQEAQAILGWNGPGSFKIINNYLEGAGENLMFGGAEPSIPNLVPSDIEIKRNYFFKPLAWKSPLVPRVGGTQATVQPDANSTLVPTTRYYYRVVAQFNGFSGQPTTPAEETEVSAVPGLGQAVRISWSAWSHNSYTPMKYIVVRTTDPPGGSRQWKWFHLGSATLSFTDIGEAGTDNWVIEAHWAVKNLFELKNARRVVIEGNIMENCWLDAQVGFAVLFTVYSPDVIEDIQFVNNIVRHAASAIQFKSIGTRLSNITVKNNLFDDINGETWLGSNGSTGHFLQVSGGVNDLNVDHNTVFHTGSIASAGGDPTTGFIFKNNILAHNAYGIFGDGSSSGYGTLNTYFPGYLLRLNLIAGADPNLYPPNNFYPASLDDAGFVDRANGNYRLVAGSYYSDKGTDGKALGCDIDALESAVYGTASTPYTGTPAAVPGIIEAENFDHGGENIAYHDQDAGNNGSVYRTSDVDIRTASGANNGHVVYNAYPGEWLKYSINVQTTGTYDIGARVASRLAGGTFHLEVDGVNVTGSLTAPTTGAWTTFQSVGTTGVSLTAGTHVLRLVLNTGGVEGVVADFDCVNINISTGPSDHIALTATTAGTPNNVQINLTWTIPAVPFHHYEVERRHCVPDPSCAPMQWSTTTNSFTDTGVDPGIAYLYRVRAVDAAVTTKALSNFDLATVIIFTDDPLIAGVTTIKAQHLIELRQAINAVRITGGLTTTTWTDPSPLGVWIRAVHVQEMRTALDPALGALGLPVQPYANPSLSGATVMRIDFDELRQRVK